jgi:hypothetical protein
MKLLQRLRLAAPFLLGGMAYAAEPSEDVRNWFNAPYFQVRTGNATCPVPLGPFMTLEEMRRESHHRAERGTRCWLAKECAKPSAYDYDPDIAAAVRSRFESTSVLRRASLWVTVQHRFVWIEGCVPSTYKNGALEKLLRDVPDVERLTINVMRNPNAKPPYRTLPDGQRRTGP